MGALGGPQGVDPVRLSQFRLNVGQRGQMLGDRGRVTAGDRPGLLCDIGKVLWEERIDLHAARISTLGERAEDVFYVTDRAQRPLEAAAA